MFCTVLKLNSGDVRFICLEAQTSVEKKSSFESLFYCANKPYTRGLTQTQIAPRVKREKQGRIMTTLGPHYEADVTKTVPEPY